MNPEDVHAMAKIVEGAAGGGTTGVLLLAVLWMYNKKNGKPKVVTEEICGLRHDLFRKDLLHIKASVDELKVLIKNGQKQKDQREARG